MFRCVNTKAFAFRNKTEIFLKALEIAVALETVICDASEMQSKLQQNLALTRVQITKPPPSLSSPRNTTSKVYYRCVGDSHAIRSCRLKDQICYHCGKVGHISRICRLKQQGKSTQVHTVEYSESDEFEDVLGSIKIHNASKLSSNVIWVDLKAKGKPLKMELDTGSAVSIIQQDSYREKFNDKPLY